jgi:flagellar biosynthesis protein FliQ
MMDLAELGRHVAAALQLALLLSAPALGASVLAGIVSGLLQSATQVQDPALAFVPRLLAVAIALLLSAAWMFTKLVAFTAALWRF